MSKSLLNAFDDEYKRLEFHTDFYKDLPDNIKKNLYDYVVLQKPLNDFLRSICSNNLNETMRHSDEEKDKLIRKIFLWFWNVCPANMYGLKNYQEFETKYIHEVSSDYV